MSAKAIQALFEKKLKAIKPDFSTAYENISHTPRAGVPYQRVNMLMNSPNDLTIEVDIVEKLGIFQVTLCYEAETGRGDIQDHAELIQESFAPQALRDGSLDVEVTDTPSISTPFNDGNRFCVAVSIPWNSFLYK